MTYTVTNGQFLKALFPELDDGEYLWAASVTGNPNNAPRREWYGAPITRQLTLKDNPESNNYYCVALMRNTSDTPKRGKDYFSRGAVIVVDDFEGEVECTYRLRTSGGEHKVQVGWALTEPITDREVSERLHKALSVMKLIPGDTSGNNCVRYVRLPVGSNGKHSPAFKAQLEIWEPKKRFSVEEVCDLLGIDYQFIKGMPTKPTESLYNALTPYDRPSMQGDRLTDAQLVQNLKDGVGIHESLNVYAARLAYRGMDERAIRDTLHGIMGAFDDGTERYQARIAEINRSVKDAVAKFAPSAQSFEPENHPLGKFVDWHNVEQEADTFVFDDLICDKIALIGGASGVGKTTALVPLFARATGLCRALNPFSDNEEYETETLSPSIKRKVIYVAEDTRQVVNILHAMMADGVFGNHTADEVSEFFKVVEAARLPVEKVVEIADLYEEMIHQNKSADGALTYDAKPLVVFDTGNSSFDLDSENDNAEVGKAIATLKQRFGGLPTVIVTHIAKALKKNDLATMSIRGAGAWQGDVNQVMFLVKDVRDDDPEAEDDNARWLEVEMFKHRFVTKYKGVRFESVIHKATQKTVLGDLKPVSVLYATPMPLTSSERRAQKARELSAESNALCKRIVDSVGFLWDGDGICNKGRIFEDVGGKKQKVFELIDQLIDEGRIERVEIPPALRIHTSKKEALVPVKEPRITVETLPEKWLKSSVPAKSSNSAKSVDFEVAGEASF